MISYKTLIVFLCLFVIGFWVNFARSFLRWESYLIDRIYPHVTIDNNDFGLKTKAEVIDFFQQKNSQLSAIAFTVVLDNQPVATLSAKMLNLHYDAQGLADRASLIGRSSNTYSKIYQKLASIYFNQSFGINATVDYDQQSIKDLLTSLENSYNRPAHNALFKFENGRVISFQREDNGLEIESAQILADFYQAITGLKNQVASQNIALKTKIIYPEITLAKANNFGIEDLLGTGKSDYSHSIPERIHNLLLASSKFDGILIPPGKTLSFNNTVGDISSLTGYKPAYIIKAGKTVLGDGGGVCQVSTTLFRAALNSGLPVIERTAHAYRVGYYENDSQPGFDATVFSPTVDLKIKNDTDSHILIQKHVDETANLLSFEFYGRKDNRRVEISPVTVWDVIPPLPAVNQDDPTLKRGVIKQVDFPAGGAKAAFDYKITYANGKISEKKFISVYRPWQAVFLVGTQD